MRTLALIVAVLTMSGCFRYEPQAANAAPAPKPTVQSAPPPTDLSVPAPPAPAPRTDVLSVRFKEINDKGYPVVIITNLTGRDIDDISGGFRLNDASGNVLHATGWTIGTPGMLLLAAGAEDETVPYGLSRKTELMQRLRSEPEALSFTFEVREVTFMGGRAGE